MSDATVVEQTHTLGVQSAEPGGSRSLEHASADHGIFTGVAGQVIWSYVNWLVIFGTGPLSLALLTRILSVSDFAVYSLLVILVRVMPRILVLGLPVYFVRTFPARPLPEMYTLLWSAGLTLSLGAGLAVAGANWVASATGLLQRSVLGAHRTAVTLALGAVVASVPLALVRGFIHASRRVAFSNLLSLLDERLWLVPVVVAALSIGVRLDGLLALWILGTLCTLAIGVGSLARRAPQGWVRFRWDLVVRGASYGIPLLPFLWGFGSIWILDRYILSAFSSPEDVAHFSVAHSLTILVASLGAVLHGAMFPFLAASRIQGRTESDGGHEYRRVFSRSVKYMALIVFPLGAAIYVLREPMVVLLGGAAYAPAAALVGGLLLVALLNCAIQIGMQDLMLRDVTRMVALLFCGGAMVHLGLSLVLVPRLGPKGTVLAGCLSHLAVLGGVAAAARVGRLLDRSVLHPVALASAAAALLLAVGVGGRAGWSPSVVLLAGILAYGSVLILGGAVDRAELRRAWRATAGGRFPYEKGA